MLVVSPNRPPFRPSLIAIVRRAGALAMHAVVVTMLIATFVVANPSKSSAADAVRLRWAPPALVNPISIDVTPANQSLVLDANRDYRLNVTQPLTAPGGLVIAGGHNVVLVGGEICVPTVAEAPDANLRRGLFLKGQTGTIHIEGLHIRGADLSEGINLDERNGATVQLQNIKVDMVHGTQATNHADVLQTWAGPAELRIDGLQATTNYQGLFLLPNQLFNGTLRAWDLRHVDIAAESGAGYALWRQDALSVNLTDVSVRRVDSAANKVFWPNASAWTGVQATTSASLTATGSVLSGQPGAGYVSPGYVGADAPSTTTSTTSPSPTVPPTTTSTTLPPVTAPTTTAVPPAPPTTASPVVPSTPSTPARRSGYWMVASDGGVFSFGDAQFFGSTGGLALNKPVVGLAGTPSGRGYWLTASDGGIFAFGDAPFFGSTGAIALNKPVVGMASTPSGRGYWLDATDGGIFAFGDAQFFGSTGSLKLNQPMVGMTPTPSGNGYWLVARDGGIFAFGDAQFFGSTGGMALSQSIVGMAATPTGRGYWLVAADGGVFGFGDARFFGSAVGTARGPITGIQSTSSGNGYWIQSSTGWSGAFGDAQDHGSLNGSLNQSVVGAGVLAS